MVYSAGITLLCVVGPSILASLRGVQTTLVAGPCSGQQQQVSLAVAWAAAERPSCRPRKLKAMPAPQACSPPKGRIANAGVSCICRGGEGGQGSPILESLRPGS